MKSLERNPELYDYIPEQSAKLNNDDLIIEEGDYSILKETNFENIYPIVEGYKDYLAYGLQFNLSDKIMLSRANIKVSYTQNHLVPSKERLHLSFNYNYWQWKVSAGLNKTNFYDLFGPTKVSRAGYYFSMGYTHNINVEKPIDSRINFSLGYFGNLQKLPQYQNVDAGFSELTTLSLNYNYSKFVRSLGAVEYESGFEIKANLDGAYFNKEVVPTATAEFVKAFLFPGLRNSSIWLRASTGSVLSNTQSSFGKMYFGGFGNNYVDRLSVQRYRELESFPGKEINELSGKDFAKSVLNGIFRQLCLKNLDFYRLMCGLQDYHFFKATWQQKFRIKT